MLVECHTCHITFPDYHALAVHISSNKKGHARGKKWAAKFLLVNGLSAKNRLGKIQTERTPLTDQQKENIEDCQRELSGETELVKTICPNAKCRRITTQHIPVEHAQEPLAWRSAGTLVIQCEYCRARQ